MTTSSKIWVITTLAIYQTRFWAAVALNLKDSGQEVVFISFDDRSTEYLSAKGFQVYSANHEDRARAEELMSDPDKSLLAYGIEDPDRWLVHERFAFGLQDLHSMKHRMLTYALLADRCFKSLSAVAEPVLIQELGGFISVVSTYCVARQHGFDNWFVEPSFFRGRQFFIKNSFAAIDIPLDSESEPLAEVKKYLNDVCSEKKIVIPVKDKHHYSKALAKIINLHNIRRLLEKTFDKYVLRKHQEFGHLKHHVVRHLLMLWNSFRLKKSYTALSSLNHFIYYPLHVPGDMALTVRSPQFLDQLAFVESLVHLLPAGYTLAIKEHPAMIGAVDSKRLKKLLKRYDQLVLLEPSQNNFDVLNACEAVVSVNSKSGAEAMLLGKPVFVMGDAFYRASPFSLAVKNVNEFGTLFSKTLPSWESPALTALQSYFHSVWCSSFPGELYFEDEANIEIFSESMQRALMQ